MAELDIEKLKSCTAIKQIPILTLDERWYHLITDKLKTDEICYWEKQVNELLKKQGQVNNDIKEASDLSYTYVIEGNPYTIKKDKDVTYLINLNTQKEEYQIPSNMQIQYVCNDVILVTHIKHRIPFIKKGSEYIEAYKFPDIHHALLNKKAQFNTCMVNGDDLLVFTL